MNKKLLLIFIFLLLLPIKVFATDTVNINTASLSQLDGLAEIGPAMAQRIVNARPFSSVDDLLRVKGIGPKTLQKIKTQGIACINCTTEIAETKKEDTTNQNPANATSSADITITASPIIYPTGIFINEILPDPAGPDEQDEWIELYNSNSSDIDLSDWQLQDQQGTITTFTIPQNTKIMANGFLVFKRPNTDIMLNNDTDGLNLLTPDKKIEDSITFTSSLLNQSYNKTPSGWKWSTSLTPGATNIITTVASVSKTASSKAIAVLPKKGNSDKNNNIEPATADLSLPAQASQTSNPWALFVTAGFAAIILAAITLLIKLKINPAKH